MNALYALKTKCLELKETLFQIESILEAYEDEMISPDEELFCKRMGLPPDASVLQFFSQLNVTVTMKTALIDLYKEEYAESFQEFQENPARVTREMRAYNGYNWLMNIQPSEVLRFRGIGRKGVSRLEAWIQKLKTMMEKV